MSRIKCFVIDDEPVARRIIREYISDIDFLELYGEAEHVLDPLFRQAVQGIDLLFLDVQLPGLSGTEYLRQARPDKLTILTTAYPDYALQGYELDVLDYLVKPIGFERFMKAAQKARDFCLLQLNAGANPLSSEDIFIKCDRKIERIALRDILYVEARANYVMLHTPQRRFTTYTTFSSMNEKLPEGLFVRIHKSYIISLGALTGIAGNKALLGAIVLPISRYYRRPAMTKINQRVFRHP